jgi:hypothetical protein
MPQLAVAAVLMAVATTVGATGARRAVVVAR